MSDSFNPQKDFDQYYYQHGCGRPYERDEEWLAFFQGIADRIIADVQPKTVLDAGCAKGFLVEGFRNRGIEGWGIDISEYAIQEVYETIKPYCWVGSIADPFPQKYDLIVTIEVLEHMPAEMGQKAIANLCAHADRIIFSSTPLDYKEATHYNVQPPEYWAREFARHGFFRDVDFDASFLTAWAVCFRKVNQPLHQLTYDYERRFWLLRKENVDLRQLTNELRNQIQELVGQGETLPLRQDSQNPLIDKIKPEWEIGKNYLPLEDNNQLYQLKLELKNLYEKMNLQLAQFTLEKSKILSQQEKQLTAIKQLEADRADAIQEKDREKMRADDFQQRWEALERTRTWKLLSSLYKIKKNK